MMRLLIIILCLTAFPLPALALQVSNADYGYSFSLPEGWDAAPITVVRQFESKADAKTRFVEAFVARDSKGIIDSKLAVYVNKAGKFADKDLKGNMDSYAREDLERMQAWAKTKKKIVRQEYSFNDDSKAVSLNYYMDDEELHKFYFFTSSGYIYLKLWGGNSDRIPGTRPFVANVKLDEKNAFATKKSFDWEWLEVDYIFWIIFGVVIFFKVKKWIMQGYTGEASEKSSKSGKSGWDKLKDIEAKVKAKAAAAAGQQDDSVVFVRNDAEEPQPVKAASIMKAKPKKPDLHKSKIVKERRKMPDQFGREDREASMTKSQYSVGAHLPKRKYLKGYK